MDALDRQIKRRVDEAKERAIVVADPSTVLFCPCCDAPLNRLQDGSMLRSELREHTLHTCRELDWWRGTEAGATVNLAVYELVRAGVLQEVDKPRGTVRLNWRYYRPLTFLESSAA